MTKKEKRRKLLLDARAICEKAIDEDRGLTAEEKVKIEGMSTDAKRLEGEIREASAEAKLVAEIMGYAFAPEGDPQSAGAKGVTLSIGQQFVQNAGFQAWLKEKAPSGHIPDSVKGFHSPPVHFKHLRKALITGSSGTSAGAFVETDYTRIVELLGRYPLNVLGLISMRQTGSDLVYFVRQTVKVQEAAMVPEANVTDYAGSTGEVSGEKPEATMTFEQVTAAVKTIAVWIPATKRALSDASQIRGLIDQELVADLDEEKENQVLNGDGVGENFTGILNTSGILLQVWDTDLLTTIRKARTNLEINGLTFPTGIVMHPNDIETLDLLKDDEGRFYFGGPSAGGPQGIWRVPVVSSQSKSEGTGLMGDYRKAVLWDREEANVTATDSHEDFFIRNMVAILAEMRAAFGVIRPTAFCDVTLTDGS